jgi:ribosomal protein S1
MLQTRFMLQCTTADWEQLKRTVSLGSLVKGRVIGQQPFGVFLDLGLGFPGLLLVPDYVDVNKTRGCERHPEIGELVEARVFQFSESNRHIRLTQREMDPEAWEAYRRECSKPE